MIVLIEPHYLPSLEFFCAVQPFDEIRLEGYEHFAKQTYRNRCYVNTSQGKKMLTIPLADRSGKIFMKDVRMETGGQWRNTHWRTIESAYRKAPFFEHYASELNGILFAPNDNLLEFNRNLLSFCLRNAGIQKRVVESVSYEKRPESGVFDLRSTISDRESFSTRNFYRPVRYHQVFGNEFVTNLSFIDLLLCEGPAAMATIRASAQATNE